VPVIQSEAQDLLFCRQTARSFAFGSDGMKEGVPS